MLKKLWDYIKDTELYFQFFEVEYPKVRFEGSCNKTGNCCKSLMLGYRFRAIRTLKEFEKEKKQNPHYQMFIPSEREYEDGFLRFRCSNLTAENTCGIHNTRPELCRKYPDPEMVRYGAKLLPGCGYKLVLEKEFGDILGEKLVSIGKKKA